MPIIPLIPLIRMSHKLQKALFLIDSIDKLKKNTLRYNGFQPKISMHALKLWLKEDQA